MQQSKFLTNERIHSMKQNTVYLPILCAPVLRNFR